MVTVEQTGNFSIVSAESRGTGQIGVWKAGRPFAVLCDGTLQGLVAAGPGSTHYVCDATYTNLTFRRCVYQGISIMRIA